MRNYNTHWHITMEHILTEVIYFIMNTDNKGGEVFSCRGKEELDPGFMRVYGRESHDTEVGVLV